jgi:hypothetical protein
MDGREQLGKLLSYLDSGATVEEIKKKLLHNHQITNFFCFKLECSPKMDIISTGLFIKCKYPLLHFSCFT